MSKCPALHADLMRKISQDLDEVPTHILLWVLDNIGDVSIKEMCDMGENMEDLIEMAALSTIATILELRRQQHTESHDG